MVDPGGRPERLLSMPLALFWYKSAELMKMNTPKNGASDSLKAERVDGIVGKDFISCVDFLEGDSNGRAIGVFLEHILGNIILNFDMILAGMGDSLAHKNRH